MQSILQFRSFKSNAIRQLKRHEANVESERSESNDERPASDRSVQNYQLSSILGGGARGEDAFQHSRQRPGDLVPIHATLTGIATRTMTGSDRQVYVVGFEGEDDELNPHNWPTTRRWMITFIVASIGFVVGLTSSVDSIAAGNAADDLHVSDVAESLATGLYLAGFGVGAIVTGPFSETFGRNPVYIVTMIIFMIWEVAAALSPNFGSQLIFRFLAGFFGATPLVVAGGSLADVWNATERTLTFPVFANAAFLGPILGPVVGGFIGQSYLGWRWCDWIAVIWAGLVLGLVVLFLPETYAPMLLKWKAEHLRQITGDDRYKSPLEVRETTLLHRIGVSLYRPFEITFRELIVLLIALYLTVIYIVLFSFLTAYPFIFGDVHNFGLGLQGLSFMGLATGICICSLACPFIYRQYKKEIAHSKSGRLPPERRLLLSMYLGWTIPVSLFWMGWTDDGNISVWSPLVASVFTGVGILSVFISCYQYIIDSYEIYAASALAGVTMIRYIAAGGAVVFAFPMYTNLGVHVSMSILGGISAAMVPIPFIFHRYGQSIRAKSSFAVKHDDE